MGALNIAGGRGGEETGGEAELEAQEPAEQQPDRGRGDDGRFVPAEKLQPETQQSRRERAHDERIQRHLEPLKQEWERERGEFRRQQEQYLQMLHQERQERARIVGALEAMQKQPIYQPPPRQEPALPDPQALDDEAQKALSDGNFTLYQRKMRELAKAEAAHATAAMRKELDELRGRQPQQGQPQQSPAQLPLHVQALLFKNEHVMMAGERGLQATVIEKQRLDIYRQDLPEPQRLAMAFELANKLLGGQQQNGQQQNGQQRAPGFDPSAAAALGGVPAGGRQSAGGGDQGGVRLTEQQAAYAKAAGMSPEEYVRWGDPQKHKLV